MQTLVQDIRYAFRILRKNTGFTGVAVLTLALGIGANSALFSVVNGVLLNPLPFPQPDQLITLHESKPNFEQGSISYPNFRDWQKENHTFSSIAVFRGYAFSLTGSGEAEQVKGEFVSSDLFPELGVKPLIGRTFAPQEDQIGAAPVALISAALWHRKFNSAGDVIGKGITLDGKDYTVIGVIPANFRLSIPGFSSHKEVFVPLGQWNNPLLPQRNSGLGIHGIGRLKPGVTIAQAQADMEAITRSLAAAFPDADKGIGAKLIPLKQYMIGDVRPYLLVLLAGVGFVLLIACVNVANLLLARSTVRMREFAIRTALGASQRRVIRQLLTESVMLAVAGGTLGLFLAAWGTRAAIAVLPAALPRAEEIGLDSRVLLFTASISLIAGILFGLAPAWKTSQPDLQESLKEGGRSASGTRHRVQGVFVVTEMAMALVLLVGAGLMIRSLTRLWSVDPGFNPHNVLTFGLTLPPSMTTASPDAIRAAYHQFDDRLASILGVVAVSQTWGAVPMNDDDERLFWLEGQPKPASANDMNWALAYIVEPDYLNVMRVPLKRGRFFTSQDNERSPHVTVIDDELAHKYFGNENPIGKRINLDGSGLTQIVGVVGHVKQFGLDSDDTQTLRAQLYVPCMQMPDTFITTPGSAVILRSAGTTASVFDSIRRASAQMSNQQVIYGARSMDELISASLAARRFSMILLGVFAGLALVLASVGIYGVISYLAAQRTREIGIRMALGARRADILRLILGRGGRLTLSGIGIGLVAALTLTRLMERLLYGVRPADPLTLAVVVTLLAFVALAASYIPAQRATKVDPMVALRYE